MSAVLLKVGEGDNSFVSYVNWDDGMPSWKRRSESQIHHIIPISIYNSHELFETYPGVFQLNSKINLIDLPTTEAGALATGLSMHCGWNAEHKKYNLFVNLQLDELLVESYTIYEETRYFFVATGLETLASDLGLSLDENTYEDSEFGRLFLTTSDPHYRVTIYDTAGDECVVREDVVTQAAASTVLDGSEEDKKDAVSSVISVPGPDVTVPVLFILILNRLLQIISPATQLPMLIIPPYMMEQGSTPYAALDNFEVEDLGGGVYNVVTSEGNFLAYGRESLSSSDRKAVDEWLMDIAENFSQYVVSTGAVFEGSDEDDLLVGGAGDDALAGGSGADILYGGSGNDYLSVAEEDFVNAGDGADWLQITGYGATVSGGAGNDVLDAQAADSATLLWGAGYGQDVILTGGGEYVIHVSDTDPEDVEIFVIVKMDLNSNWYYESVVLYIGDMNYSGGWQWSGDYLYVPGMTSSYYTSAYDPTGYIQEAGQIEEITYIEFDNGERYTVYDLIYGNMPNGWRYTVYFYEDEATGSELFKNSNERYHELISQLDENMVAATAARDVGLETLSASRSIDADAESPSALNVDIDVGVNSSIVGGDYDDLLSGSEFDDTFRSGDGNDVVFGGAGSDLVFGNQGHDTIYGGIGDDFVYGGKENDLILGGEGSDSILADRNDDIVYGNAGSDLIYGNMGNDTIYGGGENDVIYGGKGNDVIFGDVGDDTLFGDKGSDVITGGNGYDNFTIMDVSEGGDVITDFTVGADKILVASPNFGNIPVGYLTNGYFSLTGQETEHTRFIFSPSAGTLSYDADGVGVSDPIVLATFTNGAVINATDIFVIA